MKNPLSADFSFDANTISAYHFVQGGKMNIPRQADARLQLEDWVIPILVVTVVLGVMVIRRDRHFDPTRDSQEVMALDYAVPDPYMQGVDVNGQPALVQSDECVLSKDAVLIVNFTNPNGMLTGTVHENFALGYTNPCGVGWLVKVPSEFLYKPTF
jgi:hypothetical protein